MKYKIVVDKQSRTNPSSEKKEYEVDIEELRCKENVYDSLVITKDEDYVMRRLKLTEFYVLEELEEPIKESLKNINIELFEGDNYIYLIDMVGNKFYAEYLLKNDFNDTYVVKSEMKTAIEESAKGIELSVNQKLQNYSTSEEMNASINLKANEISQEVSKKVNEDEIGTKITQNYEAVKIAWNKIAEFIQMMIVNNNASLAILDSNKKVLMSLDKKGQHFYSGDNEFGNMGVNIVDNKKYISFSVDGEYGTKTSNGMAWGVTTKSDGKFFPILFIKDFDVANKSAGNYSGQLVLSACDLVLDGIATGIITGGIKMVGENPAGITFVDKNTETLLMSIIPEISGDNQTPRINILDAIKFYANNGGGYSFEIGDTEYVLMTDDGHLIIQGTGLDVYGDINMKNGSATFGSTNSLVSFDVFPLSMAQIHNDLNVEGKIYANNISSDKRIKKNIKDSKISALDIIKQIKHKEFDKKDDGKHYNIGYIAQDMEKIDPNFVIIRPKTEETEERYYINELPLIATLSKAIQEQQEQIEELKKSDEEKDNLIKTLIERIEKLEAKNEKESI